MDDEYEAIQGILENGKRVRYLIESLDIEDSKKIYNLLSNQEKDYMDGLYSANDAIVYKKIHYINKIPVGFCFMYDSDKVGKSKGDLNITIAVDNKYRGKGIATKLVKDAIKWFKDNDKYQTLSYIISKSNSSSRALAVKCGFKYSTELENNEQLFIIIKEISQVVDDTKYGHFERKYFKSKENLNKQKS